MGTGWERNWEMGRKGKSIHLSACRLDRSILPHALVSSIFWRSCCGSRSPRSHGSQGAISLLWRVWFDASVEASLALSLEEKGFLATGCAPKWARLSYFVLSLPGPLLNVLDVRGRHACGVQFKVNGDE